MSKPRRPRSSGGPRGGAAASTPSPANAPADAPASASTLADAPASTPPRGDALADTPPPASTPLGVRSRLPITSGWIALLALYYLGAALLTHYHKPAGAASLALGLLLFIRPLGQLLGQTLLGPWRELNAAAAAARAARPVDHFDYRPLVVMCTVAVSLTLLEYYGDRDVWELIVRRFFPGFQGHRYFELGGFAYWSGARLFGYVVIPFLAVLFMPGERMRDYGLALRGFFKHVWIYGLLYLIVLPALIMVSFTQPFQHTYPFYKLAVRSWTDFLSWEVLYAAQFFALEVFFRGFMLHSLKRVMGSYAIFVMAVPYCMIHYHKPIAEVLGAVAAGIVLGTLSLHTGSIWCGVLIHVSVAWSMDTLSMMQTVGFPGNPRLVG